MSSFSETGRVVDDIEDYLSLEERQRALANREETQTHSWNSNIPPETITAAGFLYKNNEGEVVTVHARDEKKHIINGDPRVENQAQLEALEFRVIRPKRSDRSKPIKTAIFSDIHNNEDRASKIWWEKVSGGMKEDRVEAPNLSPAGYLQDRRSRVEPLTETEIKGLRASNLDNLVILSNGHGVDEISDAYNEELKQKAVGDFEARGEEFQRALELQQIINTISEHYDAGDKKAAQQLFKKYSKELRELAKGKMYGNTVWHLGRQQNLNRKYFTKSSDKTWEDLKSRAKHSEVALTYELLEKYPELEMFVTIHQDNEFTGYEIKHPEVEHGERGGVYLYATTAGGKDDPLLPIINRLSNKFMNKVKAAGIAVHHGIDEIGAPDLDLTAENGFIYLPLVNDKGELRLDNTIEGTVANMGRMGLNKMKIALCLEVPGGLSDQDMEVVLVLFRDEVLNPLGKILRKLERMNQ